jgi:oxygen-independent coproporphyrinogen-3 oxidase
MTASGVGLYIHIPFCHARCGYCDFATYVGQESNADAYLHAMKVEINAAPHYELETIFVGGGTPTTLTPAQIRFLFDAVHSHFDTSRLAEATVEANPESANADVLTAYQASGINRLSFGLQSANDAILKTLDRLHTFEEFAAQYTQARRLGFQNINIDLMYGLPGQTLADWKETLDRVVAFEPEHLSAYALKIEDGTRFARDNESIDNDLEADMYLLASETLEKAGYAHYEISNFAKPGYECRHNLLYWQNAATLGVGLSAASHIGNRRWKNVRGLSEYIQGAPGIDSIELTGEDRDREDVMLGLRLNSGVESAALDRFDLPVMKQFRNLGLAVDQAGRTRLTPRGWLLSNQLFQYLV